MQKNFNSKEKKITVFFLITSIQVGGAEIVAFSLCEFLKERKNCYYEPIIFELYKTNSDYANSKREKLTRFGIEYKTLGFGSKYLSLIIAPIFLCYYFIKKKPAIIHCHTDLPDFVLAFTLKLFKNHKLKIIRTIHNVALWPTHHFVGKFTESAFKNDNIIAVSNAALTSYENLRLKYSLEISPFRKVIFNGRPVPDTFEHHFKIDKSKINIAFAGELGLRKGADVLIAVIKDLPDNLRSKIIFHIIGHGSFRSEFLSLSNGIDNLFLYEPVLDLANKLYDFDFLLLPSRIEGLALLSIESSLCQIPVITSRECLGLVETLPHNWPLLVDNNDKDHYLAIIEKICNNLYNLHAIKKNAFDFAVKNFSINRMNEDYFILYESLSEMKNQIRYDMS